MGTGKLSGLVDGEKGREGWKGICGGVMCGGASVARGGSEPDGQIDNMMGGSFSRPVGEAAAVPVACACVRTFLPL